VTDFLHVANGHSTTQTLEAAGVPGRTEVWADVLYEGPVPADLDDEALLRLRAAFLAGDAHPVEEVTADLRRWRRVIDDSWPDAFVGCVRDPRKGDGRPAFLRFRFDQPCQLSRTAGRRGRSGSPCPAACWERARPHALL